jgi:deazaflavin-dependent oxidoreductase (nitroreductase family)
MKFFMALFVSLYRRTGGKLFGQMGGFKLLLVTVTGRKTGQLHTTPVGYFPWPGGYLIVASNGGQPANPQWYLNLKKQPKVTAQIMDQVLSATAEILAGAERAAAWQAITTAAPNYAAYEKKTTREIPVVLLRAQPANG